MRTNLLITLRVQIHGDVEPRLENLMDCIESTLDGLPVRYYDEGQERAITGDMRVIKVVTNSEVGHD